MDYQKKGIFYSEFLLLFSLIDYSKVSFVVESGRARGVSTKLLSMAKEYLKDLKSIYSFELQKYTKDDYICRIELGNKKNVSLYYGDLLKKQLNLQSHLF